MSLHELIKGSQEGRQIKFLRCNDTDECLNPQIINDNNFKGTETLLLNALLGATRNMGDGIIGRYAQNSGQPTGADNGLLTGGGDYVGMALKLAVKNESAARLYVQTFSEQMAAELTVAVLAEVLTNASAAASNWKGGEAREVQELTAAAKDRLFRDLQVYYGKNQNVAAKYEYFEYLRKNFGTTEMPTPPMGH